MGLISSDHMLNMVLISSDHMLSMGLISSDHMLSMGLISSDQWPYELSMGLISSDHMLSMGLISSDHMLIIRPITSDHMLIMRSISSGNILSMGPPISSDHMLFQDLLRREREKGGQKEREREGRRWWPGFFPDRHLFAATATTARHNTTASGEREEFVNPAQQPGTVPKWRCAAFTISSLKQRRHL